MSHSRVEVLPARAAEWLPLLVSKLLVQSAEQALVVDAHGLQEAQLELLAISAQLRSESVALALELLLGDVECAKLVKSLFTFDDLIVIILIVTHHSIDFDLVLRHHGHHLMTLGLALATISLELEWDIDGIFII